MSNAAFAQVGSGILESGLNYDLFVNRPGNFLFCLDIPNCFITGAEPAYHGRITVEMTGNLNCNLHQARAMYALLRPGFCSWKRKGSELLLASGADERLRREKKKPESLPFGERLSQLNKKITG